MKKKSNRGANNDLLPEYDFRTLPVVARGPGRKRRSSAAGTNIVVIDPKVRDVFPDDDAVNQALRALAPVLRKQRKAVPKRRIA